MSFHMEFGLRRSIPVDDSQALITITLDGIVREIEERHDLHERLSFYNQMQNLEDSPGARARLQRLNMRSLRYFT